ncbi:MAG: hypothetical protein IPL98_16190 [Saprospiraceae bacterium]|nr:hypothetical protein [Saprospiraceae bacterium]
MARVITDDELGIAIYDWRNKLGKAGQLIVTIDACHSGSATRGMSNLTARGTELKMMESEDIKHSVDSKLEREKLIKLKQRASSFQEIN